MTDASRDYGRELYPFLYDAPAASAPGPAESAAGASLDDVLDEVRRSTLQKCQDVVTLRRQLLAEYREVLVVTAEAVAAAFARGRKLIAFGNGGSATDAQDAAADCLLPPFPHWRALPALALPNDAAVVTGVGNDVGFDNVFLRQLIALGEPGDVALGFSTSGNSRNVVAALAEARRRGLVTVAVAGYDGGAVARDGAVDFCFVARTDHIPRIQEGHATLWHALLEVVQELLSGRPARRMA